MSVTIMALDVVKGRLKDEAAVVESWLRDCLSHPTTPPGLAEAMEYSLHAGGKRIRPVLCMLAARACGQESPSVLPFAGALECIHTYSLIHDDLPAMDDDDTRRGKPSNHKRFDEATAILAGDGLLTDAFAFMASLACKGDGGREPAGEKSGVLSPARVIEAIRLVAEAAGSPGMVGGQYLDMRYTSRESVTLDELAAMHAMKTGALLRVACEAGAVLAGAELADREALVIYGKAIGAAFQITDDILDETGDEMQLGKPVGSDAAMGKITYPSLVGLEKSRMMAFAQADRAVEALKRFQGPAADLLRGLAAYIVNRVS